MDQIIHITWCERKTEDKKEKVPRMLVIHISDLYQKHKADNIDGDFQASAPTAVLEKEHPDILLRCHECYLVNPRYIVTIKRFSVTLINGKTLPIPEKKYTAFKKAVHEKFINNNLSL